MDVVLVPGPAAGVTAAWRRAGELADDPIELYEDIDRKLRPRPDLDVKSPAVQARLLALARGVGGPNVWVLSPPCTSFSDWQLHNGCTRTFAKPQGGGSAPLTASEAVGNVIACFMADLFAELLAQGKVPLVEHPASSRRYPKLWDFPLWKRLARRSDCFSASARGDSTRRRARASTRSARRARRCGRRGTPPLVSRARRESCAHADRRPAPGRSVLPQC